MKELLQKLLEADVFSEDTKKELEEAFNTQLEKAIEEAKAKTETDVKANLSEQWVEERDALIEAIDTKVQQFLQNELNELKEDIDRFRDLEAEAAEKLVEAKAEMGKELQEDLAQLIEKLDAFLEIRIASEISELQEDIKIQRENNFGRKIIEAVKDEILANYMDGEDMSTTIAETKARLEDTEKALVETEEKLATLERENKLRKVLSPLSGRSRDVMEAILKNVATEQLEEGYKTFIGRVLKEADDDMDYDDDDKKKNRNNNDMDDDDDDDDDDHKDIDDDNNDKKKNDNDKKNTNDKKLKEGRIVTGDSDMITERDEAKRSGLSESEKQRLRAIAGL